jgi:riboflavin kinase / FMN adenylyltransferase
MQQFHSLDDIRLHNAWLTIGIFDGVHRGHQKILRKLVSEAHGTAGPAVVLTFFPHPAIVLGGNTDFKSLTTPDERAALLGSFGVDTVITQTFDRKLAEQTALEFMRLLSRTLGLRHLIIGYDTALGKGREGDAARLMQIGDELGFTVLGIPPLADETGIISSTRIRQKISIGAVSSAAADLGRNYSITGRVIHGEGRGRTINIPTANIQIPMGKILPAYGIYACQAWVNGRRHPAATSIGVRPTFYSAEPPAPSIEAHLLDFDRDIYGQDVLLEFIDYLRPEIKYSSSQALVEQIQKDVSQTRTIVGA